MKRIAHIIIFSMLIVALLANCDQDQRQQQEDDLPVNVLVAAGDYERYGTLSNFLEALTLAGLTDTLSSDEPYTVFMPTNNAFEAMPGTQEEQLFNNEDRLREVLLNHIVKGRYSEANLSDGDQLTTLGGTTLNIEEEDGKYVSGAGIIEGDIYAENGVIHVMNGVIVSP